jgi:adenylate kinase family enzyme
VERVVVLGNSGGGKSTIARAVAGRFGLPHVELDALLWRPGWQPVEPEIYAAEHARCVAGERWVLDGLGRLDSIPARLARASDVVLVDMPLWMHYWLAADRQTAWATGRLDHPPAGGGTMPPTQGLFRTMWEVERDWTPKIRRWVDVVAERGTRVVRLASVDAVTGFASGV